MRGGTRETQAETACKQTVYTKHDLFEWPSEVAFHSDDRVHSRWPCASSLWALCGTSQ
jgi:hypothetical protein